MNKQTGPVVHIVDDDDAVRDSISLLLASVNIASQTYINGQAFLDSEITCQTGCIVLDIRMPGISGLECQKKLEERGCGLPIIFITGHGDIPMAVEAMKHGAMEFIQKPFREQELLDCIQHALQINLEKQGTQVELADIKRRLASLTPREHEIIQKIAEGKANKVIAFDLNLSQRTVEIHRAHVMEKMQAKSLAELVKMTLLSEK